MTGDLPAELVGRLAASRAATGCAGCLMRRLVESIFLVVGASALGAVAGGPGLAFLAAATLFRPRPGAEPGTDWGSAAGFLGCGLCGGGVGAAVGFTWAGRRIARGQVRPWTAATWVGVGVGVAAAGAVLASGLPAGRLFDDLVRWRPGAVVFLTATGALGGLIGTAVEAGWAARAAGSIGRAGPRPRARKRRRRPEEPNG